MLFLLRTWDLGKSNVGLLSLPLSPRCHRKYCELLLTLCTHLQAWVAVGMVIEACCVHYRCHRSPLQGMLCKWVHEKRHGSPRLLLFLVAFMSGLLVHTRAGRDFRSFSVGLTPGFCIYIVVAPGLALGSHCSPLSGLEGNLPLGAQQRCAF